MPRILRNSILGGLLTVTATSLWLIASSPTSKRAAPINAVSHIAFGDEAFRHDEPSVRYSATGFFLNSLAVGSWSLLHEMVFGRRGRSKPLAAAASGAAVSALAYVVDYHMVPERFKPGFERKVSKSSLAGVYAILALGLAATALLRDE